MGAVRLIYDETLNQFKKVGWWGELNTKGTRKAMQGSLRYCLQNNTLYLPEDDSILKDNHRLCWGRIRSEYLDLFPSDLFNIPLDKNPLDYHMPFTGIGFGKMYSKRHLETTDGREPVKEFISQNLIESISSNPEVLLDVNKDDFEALMAEIFTRMGFQVDLYRKSKDDGIDFLAVDIDENDTKIFCVQCKHPNKMPDGKKRRAMPVATVREIYGVAKAHDLQGCIAISSSRYSKAAKEFSDLKKEEIQVANEGDIISWIKKYRWMDDE